jgi:hypothetical protein
MDDGLRLTLAAAFTNLKLHQRSVLVARHFASLSDCGGWIANMVNLGGLDGMMPKASSLNAHVMAVHRLKKMHWTS